MASPEEIYLQWYDENGEEPQDGSEVTWCQDRINDTDVRYVKLSFITAIQEKLSKDESEIAELTSTCSQCKEPAWCETKAENKRLTKELAEAEADAERFDRRRIQCNDMEEFRCVFCGKLQNEDYSWEKDETDELHCKDCIHILHRERLSCK